MLCLQSHFRMDQAFFLINFYSRVVAFLCCDSFYCTANISASQVALVVKNPPGNAGDIRDMGLIHSLGRFPGVGNGTHSSILARRIPWIEEPGGLHCIGSQS